jgi:cytochrome c553
MRYLIFLLGFIFIVSCKDSRKGYQATEATATDVALNENSDPGRKIVENECYICHNPRATEATMIAPPLVAVKRHYINEQTSEEEFTEALINWISDPQVEKSRMRGALRRFGVMPYQPYSEEAIRDIASYIYNTELPQPEWFEEHFQKGHGKGKGKGMGRGKGMQMGKKSMQAGEDESYSPLPSYYNEKGMEVVTAAQGVLGKKLMTAIQERGPEGAIAFCKAAATGLTDSVGIMKNAAVKRVTDKPRNTANQATVEEVGFITAFKRQVENNGEIRPITKEMNEDEVYFYYPIVTNAMCLQCHGTPNKEVTAAVGATLATLYPQDQATGYDIQQVRGMWRIQFIKEK